MANPDPYSRGRAKLRAAVEVLATGKGDVRWRLHVAYLHLVGALGSQLPTDIRRRLQQVKRKLTSRRPKYPGIGALSATLHRMRLRIGAVIAKEIVSIDFDLQLRR